MVFALICDIQKPTSFFLKTELLTENQQRTDLNKTECNQFTAIKTNLDNSISQDPLMLGSRKIKIKLQQNSLSQDLSLDGSQKVFAQEEHKFPQMHSIDFSSQTEEVLFAGEPKRGEDRSRSKDKLSSVVRVMSKWQVVSDGQKPGQARSFATRLLSQEPENNISEVSEDKSDQEGDKEGYDSEENDDQVEAFDKEEGD